MKSADQEMKLYEIYIKIKVIYHDNAKNSIEWKSQSKTLVK